MSLKNILNNELKSKGYLSLDQVHIICKENNYKESNGERRLRPSESPDAIAVLDDKKHIVGYRWKKPSERLPASNIEELKTQPRLFELPKNDLVEYID